MVNSMGLWWTSHVALMKETRNACRKLENRLYEKIILKGGEGDKEIMLG
jgi:hypothetical protein